MSIILKSVILDKVSSPSSSQLLSNDYNRTINIELQVEVQTTLYVYEVGLRGSNDDWQTMFDIKTFHYVRHNINGAQLWKLICPMFNNKNKLDFALYAKILDDKTLWDNNDGYNYTLFNTCHDLGHTNHNVKVWHGDKVVSFA